MVYRVLLGTIRPRLATALSLAALVAGCAVGTVAPIDAPSYIGQDNQELSPQEDLVNIGDKLKVTVFGEDNLSGPVEVNTNGQISIPLVGEIDAKGSTLQDLRSKITNRLSQGYLKNPKVTVERMNYRPIYIQGEVKNAGEYPYKAGLNLRDVIAMAGGYTYRADESFLYLGRGSKPNVAISTPGNMQILPGDSIRIPERFF